MIHHHLVEGHLAYAPSHQATKSGRQFTTFRILFNDSYRGADGQWQRGKSRSLEINCWSPNLIEVARGLSKGDRVVVECANDLFASVNPANGYSNISVSARSIVPGMKASVARAAGQQVMTADREVYDADQYEQLTTDVATEPAGAPVPA